LLSLIVIILYSDVANNGKSPQRNNIRRYRRKPGLDERRLKIKLKRTQIQLATLHRGPRHLLRISEQGKNERLSQQAQHLGSESENTDEKFVFCGDIR
jgi:hypothetical protein